MKFLFGNRKGVVSVFVALMLVLGMHVASYALPVSERTPQVRDAIVKAVPGVNNAPNVTAAHLAAITSLDLSLRGTLRTRQQHGIKTLKIGDFDGLTGLKTLYLNGNRLSTLPAGIFDDLTALEMLFIGSNFVFS